MYVKIYICDVEADFLSTNRCIAVGLYGCFERRKGRTNQIFNTLKNTKITILKKDTFF